MAWRAGRRKVARLETFLAQQLHSAESAPKPEPAGAGALSQAASRTAAGQGLYGRGFSTEASTSGRSVPRAPVSYLSLALTLATGSGLLYFYNHQRDKQLQELLRKQETVGKAAIGGPFELVDHTGRKFTDRDLLGKFALLYFGFTHCPDICPEELEKMTSAMQALGSDVAKAVQPVFITLDPERDSVTQVGSYIQEFGQSFIGLTGTSQQVKDAARSYRVYYTKTNDSPEDYLIDHSIIMYLVDPKGEFVTFYGKNFTAETLAQSVRDIVTKWQASH